jgi:hypothetical protein
MDALPRTVPRSCHIAARADLSGGNRLDGLELESLARSAGCCYGGTDWLPINRAVLNAVLSAGGDSQPAILAELEHSPLEGFQLKLAREWLEDGVTCNPELTVVSGGEHRLCALRQQGAEKTVVFVP